MNGCQRSEEVTIVIWCAEHTALRRNVGVLAPSKILGVAAALEGVSALQEQKLAIAQLGLEVHTGHIRTIRVLFTCPITWAS